MIFWKISINSVASVLAVASLGSSAQGATLISSTFNSVGLTGTQNIDVTGSNVVDWGYYNLTSPGSSFSGVVSNKKADSGIGLVSVAPGAIGAGSVAANPRFTITFNDGVSPSSSTVAIGNLFGAWGASEDNAATFTFNDLGAGTHTAMLFVGHGSNNRIFDIDYTVTAADGGLSGNTVSNLITSGDLHSTYKIVFSTTDANADLTLQLNSTSGGTGSGWIGGYVVETVPEPASTTLLALGVALLAIHRRR